MKIEKWPGTRAFSAEFNIERARVAKHNKTRTYSEVAYVTYLLTILYQIILAANSFFFWGGGGRITLLHL